MPDHAIITKVFKLLNWHSDQQCTAFLAPTKHVLKDFFGAGQGPHKHLVSKKVFDIKIAELSAAKRLREAALQPQVDVEPALVKSKEKKSQAIAEKAKLTLAKHRETKAKAMEISLG